MNGGSALTTDRVDPDTARRAWPRWLAGGAALLVVAAVAVFWVGGGARLLLGVVGGLLALRGAVLLAGTGGTQAGGVAGRLRGPGAAAVAGGLAAIVVAVTSAAGSGWVLLAGVPAGLLAAGLVLLGRGRPARRGGLAVLVWCALVTGLLVVTGVAADWPRAVGGATVVTALGIGLLGVFLLVGGANLRTVAARPAPVRPAGCAGCACAAGGCGRQP